jgi:hypothetical protein
MPGDPGGNVLNKPAGFIMKKLFVITAASAVVFGYALNAFADVHSKDDRPAPNVNLALSNSNIAYAQDDAIAIVAQGNVVTQVISSTYNYYGGESSINATNPSAAGSASAGTVSGTNGASFGAVAGRNGLGAGLDDAGSVEHSAGYAQVSAPVSAGCTQSLSQSMISNGIGNSVNSINILATNSISQLGIGGSFSSVSNTTISEGNSGSDSDSAGE